MNSKNVIKIKRKQKIQCFFFFLHLVFFFSFAQKLSKHFLKDTLNSKLGSSNFFFHISEFNNLFQYHYVGITSAL